MKKEYSIDNVYRELMEKGTISRGKVLCSQMVSHTVFELVKTRIQKGISQRDLAKQTGLHQSAIARIESLQVVPRLDTLANLAQSLGVTIGVIPEFGTQQVVVNFVQANSKTGPEYYYEKPKFQYQENGCEPNQNCAA